MAAYRRLTKTEIRAINLALCGWQTPAEMMALEQSTHSLLGSENYSRQAGLSFLREAFIAARVAGLWRNTEAIRLVAASRPDFEVRLTSKTVWSFEVTEADRPGRRRGDEYKGLSPDVVHIEHVDQWQDESDCRAFGPQALHEACARKAEGSYSKEVNLVVYFNFDLMWADRRRELALTFFLDSTAVAKDAFRNVFVHWGGELYWIWQGSSPRLSRFLPLDGGHGGLWAA